LKIVHGLEHAETVTEPVLELPIRVFLVVQNRLLRDALVRFFRKQTDLLVVGSHGSEECYSQKLSKISCDVLVLDSFDAKWLLANLECKTDNSPSIKLLLIGMSDDWEQFVAAVRGGVTGYLSGEASAAEIVAAVQARYRGEPGVPA
jgi:DNA-binding NarL/FixJ family response regulator